jgi:hypothetical protein
LEGAERHLGIRLIRPDLPQLPHLAWHERHDPGEERLGWLTRSQWLSAVHATVPIPRVC